MNNITSLWEPNNRSGFLPCNVSYAPSDLVQYHDFQLIGEWAEKLGFTSNHELEQLVLALDGQVAFNLEDSSPEFCEGLLRSYVYIAAHLIHRPYFASKKELPASIAKPIWALSKYVGRPPSLTYASYILSNFTEPIEGRKLPGDIKVAQTLTGTPDEKWFIAVHLAAESVGGEIVDKIKQLEIALQQKDLETVILALNVIGSSIEFANSIFSTVKGNIDPEVFRNSVRPLLFGHDIIKFRGVENEPSVTYIGETGAQSGMMRAVDISLATRHSDKTASFFRHFTLCAPPPHKAFFEYSHTVGQALLECAKKEPMVRKARSEALYAIAKFRRSHLAVVNYFLVSNGKKLTETGTGGTDFLSWLGSLASETEADASS